ncbi:MAG TPA: DUF2206 domain-containing protein, partial [Dehalococcoidia bacterium]|nr:DUF2206 domain-containing protein [Dehalococcoidia bacterium]
LTAYIISNKYLSEFYAFLAALFVTFQLLILQTPLSPRTNLALFFFALCIMVLFTINVSQVKRVLLFTIFIAATVVSHYSTTYIFFFLLLFTGLLTLVLRKHTLRKNVTLISSALVLALVFLWGSVSTLVPLRAGFNFVKAALLSLKETVSFDMAVRGKQVELALGVGQGFNTLDYIYLIITWLCYAFITAGVIATLIKRRKILAIPKQGKAPAEFTKERIDAEYFLMALACCAIAVGAILLPYISKYGLTRSFPMLLVILSTFFVLGGMMLSKHLKLGAPWLILLLSIPYFMFVSGAAYEVCGIHEGALRSQAYSTVISSKVPSTDYELVYDQEVKSARWLKEHNDGHTKVFAADAYGKRKLVSQGKFTQRSLGDSPFFDHVKVTGYIWLSYNNVRNSKLTYKGVSSNISDYQDVLIGKNRIYTNGGSEVWR